MPILKGRLGHLGTHKGHVPNALPATDKKCTQFNAMYSQGNCQNFLCLKCLFFKQYHYNIYECETTKPLLTIWPTLSLLMPSGVPENRLCTARTSGTLGFAPFCTWNLIFFKQKYVVFAFWLDVVLSGASTLRAYISQCRFSISSQDRVCLCVRLQCL